MLITVFLGEASAGPARLSGVLAACLMALSVSGGICWFVVSLILGSWEGNGVARGDVT